MNIVELHKEIDSINDIVNSPRFESWQKDSAINYAAKNIVKNRYETAKSEKRSQRTASLMRLRDELFTIVAKKSTTDAQDPIVISNDIITLASLPERYVYLLAVKFKINNLQEDYASYVNFNEIPVLKNDPFRRPSKVYPYKFYYILSSVGIELEYGKHSSDEATQAEIYFLKNPIDVNYGKTLTPSSDAVASDTNVISQANGTQFNGNTYNEGEEFVITNGGQLTAGSASYDFTNTDIPEILHTELAQEAAKFLELKVRDFDKWRAMEEKEMIDKR